MARQIGPLGVAGKLDDVVFYEVDGEKFVKMGGGPRPNQWRNSDSMVRSRENASVFGAASMMGSRVYRGLTKALREMCGGYMHNRIAAELVKGARETGGGRLPERYPVEVAVRRLLHMELGEDAKKARKVLRRYENRTDVAPEKLAAAREKVMQTSAKLCLGARHDAEKEEVLVTGLLDTSRRLVLREKEMLEFRLHVSLVKVTGVEMEAGSGARGKGLASYIFEGGEHDALRMDVVSDWMPCEANAGLEDGLTVSVPDKLADGSTALVVVGVEWRALRGFRERKLHGAGIVRIAGVVTSGASSALQGASGTEVSEGASATRKRRERSAGERARRKLLVDRMRERQHGVRAPKERLRTAVRGLERKLRKIVV